MKKLINTLLFSYVGLEVLILGLLTRPAAAITALTMAVFGMHWSNGHE